MAAEEEVSSPTRPAAPAADFTGSRDWATGDHLSLPARSLTQETCARWDYRCGTDIQIANYWRDGRIVGQKLRKAGKRFSVVGKVTDCLFGQQLWGAGGGKKIVITEGEIDAMSVSQVQDHKWPVVSIPNGVDGAAQALNANIEWLLTYEQVILMFDNDEPGRRGIDKVAALFPPGRVYVAELPLKDANDMLKAGRGGEIITAIWRAKAWRPDGLVTAKEVKARATQTPEIGLPWCFEFLTEATYGRRWGEIYGLGAGVGCGKTDFFLQQIAFDISQGFMPALFLLEQEPGETVQRLAGKLVQKPLHIPGEATEEERRDAVAKVPDELILYDSFGSNDWDVIKTKFRYLANSGTRIIYLDHLTALADTSNERESMEQLMKEMATMAMELKIIIHFVSHLATPEGKPHEEGGRVMAKHFKGSRAIAQWAHYMFGIERNTQADDPTERNASLFRCIKDRKTGRANGLTHALTYDRSTAMLLPQEFSDDSTQRPSPQKEREF